MRILNRPATQTEIETCRKDMQGVDDDHRRMAEELSKRELQYALNRPILERQRQVAIATAQAAIASFEKAQAPKLAEEQRKRAEATAKLEADLKAYESTVLAKKMADWEKEKAASIINRWQVLEPKALSATNRSIPAKEPDGSIVVSGSNKNGVVTIETETDLTGITGLRLEVLTDSRLPNNGPGRATDGNFVLNELELDGCPQGQPETSETR